MSTGALDARGVTPLPHRREIDGLRAVALLPVLLFHAGFSFCKGGFVGVDVFFVISGYLITSIIIRERLLGSFSVARFYERRARRILPALFLVILTTLPFAWALLPPNHLYGYYLSVAATALFASNLLFWYTSGYFDTASEFKPLLHTWSLAIEEQYYIIFPILLLALWRLGGRRVFVGLLLIAAASLGFAQWASSATPALGFFLLPSRFWELMVGSLVASFEYNRGASNSPARPDGTRQVLSTLGIAMILGAATLFDEGTPFPSVYALAPTCGAALVILFASRGTFVNRVLGMPLFVGVGLISYSAYLWHQPVLVFLRQRQMEELDPITALAALAGSLALGFASWRLVEQPFRNRQRVSVRTVAWLGLAGTGTMMAVGVAGYLRVEPLYAGASEEQKARVQAFAELSRQRQRLIRVDECHYNGETGATMDAFVDQWDCWDDGKSPSLKKIPVVVAGDSQAADMVVSLRLNGLLPLQMTAAGCAIDPEQMTPDCKRSFEKLFERLKGDDYFRYLLITNRYTAGEGTPEAFQRSIDYWERLGLETIVLTGVPEFSFIDRAIFLGVDLKPDRNAENETRQPEVRQLLERRGVHVVDRGDLYCSLSGTCSYKDDNGDLLLLEYSHLSPIGAQRFGVLLIRALAELGVPIPD